MTRKQQILSEAAQHIRGTDFRIRGMMIDIEGDGNQANVTCLTFTAINGEERFIAIDLIWW